MRLTWGRSIFSAAGLGAIALAAACRHEPPPLPLPEPLDVAFAGCAAVVKDGPNPVCELGDTRTLRIVTSRPVTSIRAGDAALDPTSRSIPIPAGARELVVDAGRARFSLRIADARRFAWLDEAKGLRAKEPARAKEIAAAHAGDPDVAARGSAKGLLGRIALAEGRADEAFPLLREAIALDREAGRVSDAVDDSFALAFALHQRSHRYDEARVALDGVKPELPLYPEGRAREPYYRGILAAETGDRRGALALLRDAEVRARDLGMARLERNARSALALEMQMTGRARASLEILRALGRDPSASPCERVEIANNVGWGALLANESAGAVVEDARGPLEQALAIEGCADAYPRSFALGNLARLAIDGGDADAAAKHLAAARAAVKEPRGTERLAWLDLEGRILLAKKKAAEALARFDEERALARAAVLLEPEWSALVGRAEALVALGRTDDAIAALLEAEEKVDRAMLLVPLGEGRGAFVSGRSRSARAAVELLAQKGRAADAARVAKHARARVLASLERALRIERLVPSDRARWEAAVRAYRGTREALDAAAASDWKLAADALARTTEERRERERELRTALESALAVIASPPEPSDEPVPEGDLELVIHPGRSGWIAIAVDTSGAEAHPLAGPTAPDLGHALFDPIAGRIDRARRVRVRGYGAFRRVDVHALPFHDAPLVAKVVVDYPIGLRAAAAKATGPAVVIGDPTGDLAGALAEARSVTRALEARGGHDKVRALLQGEATSSAVASALRGASLLHYAGHGVFAGREGWESALPLAEGGRLAIGDVLALAPGPTSVVLSGCEAARDDDDAEGLGLAQAFVAAGADEVVAPTRRVDDALAADLTSRLYEGAPPTLAASLASAQRALRERGDWAAFRVLAR